MGWEMQYLDVSTDDIDDGTRTRVRLSGEIDAIAAARAAHTADDLLARGRPVLVDLGAVTFMDSSGVSFLIQLRRSCERAGLDWQLTGVPAQVERVLSILGVDDLLRTP